MSPTTSREQSAATGRRVDRAETTNHSQPTGSPRFRKRRRLLVVVVVLLAVAGTATGYVLREWWLPDVAGFFTATPEHAEHAHGDHDAVHEHDEASHDHADHDETDADHDHADAGTTVLELSAQAQKNIGLRLATVRLQDFDRTISVPATVKDRAGRTEFQVSAPMTGIVLRIYPIAGEAVTPGEPLFDLRLTHEDLVAAQSAFLETLEQLDVIKREVARLDEVTSSGAVAGKRLLERQYDQQQTEARLHAQEQAMILHGITQEQVDQIKQARKLLQQVTIFAPEPVEPSGGPDHRLLQVTTIAVSPGEHVEAGDPLCVLSDHAVLYIEGKAFEEDSGELNAAANAGSPITAVIASNGKTAHTVAGLKILYLGNEVELESRALRFYVRLPNELVRNERTEDGHRFIGWRFKPGQRVQLRVPVERWKDRIVLPVDAVVEEGAESFVFENHAGHFDRKPVHVEHRDQRWAVIANDGSLSPGDTVVAAGAYQMHLTMKNKAGGGVDPHAGHNH